MRKKFELEKRGEADHKGGSEFSGGGCGGGRKKTKGTPYKKSNVNLSGLPSGQRSSRNKRIEVSILKTEGREAIKEIYRQRICLVSKKTTNGTENSRLEKGGKHLFEGT